ncbi:hypothetical protein AA3266_2750 [Gluconobacter kondonii NBRC 3266]|nr:hypothetical protein AA3266_2750 [Gluconobacter kondonii NBRC 3266]
MFAVEAEVGAAFASASLGLLSGFGLFSAVA